MKSYNSKYSVTLKVPYFPHNRFMRFPCKTKRFSGSYFRVLVVGRENRENLDLAKISRYTVFQLLAVPTV